MKRPLPIGILILAVIVLGVANILILRNIQNKEVTAPTSIIQEPSPTVVIDVPMLTDPILATGEGKPMVGNDRDTHGCIGSAGYTWCEVKNKCLRVWEEKCE